MQLCNAYCVWRLYDAHVCLCKCLPHVLCCESVHFNIIIYFEIMFRLINNVLKYKCNSLSFNSQIVSIRHILSSSYFCEVEWEKRLRNELLKKISPREI